LKASVPQIFLKNLNFIALFWSIKNWPLAGRICVLNKNPTTITDRILPLGEEKWQNTLSLKLYRAEK